MSKKPLLEQTKAYYELFRPYTLVAPVIGAIFFGLLGLKDSSGLENIGREWWKILLSAFILSTGNAGGNIFNAIADIEVDRSQGPPKSLRPLPSGRLSVENGLSFGVLVWGLGLTLAFTLINITYALILAVIFFFAFIYAFPPRLKRRLFWGNLSIATPRGGLGLVAAYSAFGNPFDPKILIAGIIFGAFVFGANITKDFPDEAGDRLHGIRNFVTVYGRNEAAHLVVPFLFVPYVTIGFSILIGILPYMSAIVLILLPLTFFLMWVILKIPDAKGPTENNLAWALFYIHFAALMIFYTVPLFIKLI